MYGKYNNAEERKNDLPARKAKSEALKKQKLSHKQKFGGHSKHKIPGISDSKVGEKSEGSY